MHQKYAFALILILLSFVAFPGLGVEAASTDVASQAELIAAIEAANATPEVDVINLTADIDITSPINTVDYLPIDMGLAGLPPITTPIIIMGNGFEISRASAQEYPLFLIIGPLVGPDMNGFLTLDNITLRGGGVSPSCALPPLFSCGGAIISVNGILEVRNNSLFVDNSSVLGGAIAGLFSIIDISDSEFRNNQAELGGAIALLTPPGLLTSIRDSLFVDNTALTAGGAIMATGEMLVEDSSFINNQSLSLNSTDGGGAIAATGLLPGFNIIEIYNSYFEGNSGASGGAILNATSAILEIYNSQMVDNSARQGGAIASLDGTFLQVFDSQIEGNQATAGNGGGILVGEQSSLQLEASLIQNNSANLNGGGISLETTTALLFEITNSNISGNSARSGGGIYQEGSAPLEIINSRINNNSSQLLGGGMTIDGMGTGGSVTTVTDSTFNANTVSNGDGGGIAVTNAGYLSLLNTTLSRNVANGGGGVSGRGGGLFLDNSSSTATFSHSTISNNQGGTGGGVYVNNGATLESTYSTIVENTADLQGGGAYVLGSSFALQSSILALNTANHPVNPQEHNCGTNNPASYTFTGANFTDNDFNCPASANLTLSPALNLGPLADNSGPTETHSLLPGSVAINANGNCGTRDQRGVLRDTQCDSGAYEALGQPALVSFALASSTINEQPGGSLSVDIILDNTNGTVYDGPVRIYITVMGSASGGSDYEINTILPITFVASSFPPPGSSTTQTIDLSILPDYLLEGDETIVLSITEMGIAGPADLGAIDTHTVTILDAQSDLSVSKAVSLSDDADGDTFFSVGDRITYTVTLTNNGPFDANNITVEDVLDSSYFDLSSAAINTSVGTYDPTTNEWSADGAGVGNGFALAANQSATLSIDLLLTGGVDGDVVENVAAISRAFLPNAADPDEANDQGAVAFTLGTDIIVTPTPTPVAPGAGPDIAVFDPAISKLGLLQPGQLGAQGEVLEWVITVTNRGGAAGINVQVTDSLRPELRLDRVEAPGLGVAINGQSITVTIPSLAPGESRSFSLFTTVLQGDTSLSNTACVIGTGGEVCATGTAIRSLPATGETPLMRPLLLLGLLLAGGLLGLWGLLGLASMGIGSLGR